MPLDDPCDFLSDAVAMFLQPGSFDLRETYAVFLILKPFGDGYKRVGITEWDNEWCMEKIDGEFKFIPGRLLIKEHLERQALYVQ